MPEPTPTDPKPTPERPHDLRMRPDSDPLFAGTHRPEPRQLPVVPIAIAAVVILVVLGILLATGRRHGASSAAAAGAPATLQPLAPYASQLRFTDLALSESTNLVGGKETFVDGKVTNAGTATVTGVTLQVLFGSDGGSAPQLETVPLNLIRTRQPYIDVQPVSAAPLAPGATAEFRLTFDDVRPEWNQQNPELHVIGVTTR